LALVSPQATRAEATPSATLPYDVLSIPFEVFGRIPAPNRDKIRITATVRRRGSATGPEPIRLWVKSGYRLEPINVAPDGRIDSLPLPRLKGVKQTLISNQPKGALELVGGAEINIPANSSEVSAAYLMDGIRQLDDAAAFAVRSQIGFLGSILTPRVKSITIHFISQCGDGLNIMGHSQDIHMACSSIDRVKLDRKVVEERHDDLIKASNPIMYIEANT
jgi:hypothetical protein